jgi:ribose transport system substrate-binding protein
MKRIVSLFVIIFISLLLVTMVFAGGKKEEEKKKPATTTTTEPEFTMKGEPVLEPKLPVGADVEGAGAYSGEYSYEFFRKQALTGSFKENYAKDYKLAITNLAASVPICTQIVNSIVEYWKLAGGKDENLLVLDNAFDVNTTIKNADAILAWEPDVFVQYGVDEKSNTMIARKAMDKGNWILGLDVTVKGYPFMGGDNWANGVLIGEFAIEKINEQFGGIENVDRIYYCWNPDFGEVVSYRMWGARKVMVEEFGYMADFLADPSMAVQVEVGADYQSPWMDILAKYPDDKNVVVFSPFEAASAGFYAAAKTLGRWDTDNMLLCSLGGDDLGRPLIRSGITDGTVGWVPETYGTYVVPLALSHIYGKPIPSVTYLEHVILTKENIDDYYPGETTLYAEE